MVTGNPDFLMIKCADCQQDFLFGSRDQDYYRQNNWLHVPKRCKQCRIQRREQRLNFNMKHRVGRRHA